MLLFQLIAVLIAASTTVLAASNKARTPSRMALRRISAAKKQPLPRRRRYRLRGSSRHQKKRGLEDILTIVNWDELHRVLDFAKSRYSSAAPAQAASSGSQDRAEDLNEGNGVPALLEKVANILGAHHQDLAVDAATRVMPGAAPVQTTAPPAKTDSAPETFNNNAAAPQSPPPTSAMPAPTGSGSAKVTMHDRVIADTDNFFYAMLSIGTPPQEFPIIMDTGSSDTWAVSSDCQSNCPTADGVVEYDSSASSTFKDLGEEFAILYGAGYADGTLGTDEFRLGNLVATNQTFARVKSLSNDWKTQVVSGIAGLGFSGLANSGGTPLLQSFVNQGSISAPLMSFYFGRAADDDETDSSMTLGTIDDSRYTGELKYFPLSEVSYWQIPFKGYSTAQGEVASAHGQAIIDTGTTLLVLPYDEAKALFAKVPEAYEVETGYWAFDCQKELDISVEFEGMTVKIDPSDLNLGKVNSTSTECVAGISGLYTLNDMSIMGLTFLKNVYSVFDATAGQERVGFATPT